MQHSLITLSLMANAVNGLFVIPVAIDIMVHIFLPWTVELLCYATLTMQVLLYRTRV